MSGSATEFEMNCAISRTSSCPPMVAQRCPKPKSSVSTGGEDELCRWERESFKKTKADKVLQNTEVGGCICVLFTIQYSHHLIISSYIYFYFLLLISKRMDRNTINFFQMDLAAPYSQAPVHQETPPSQSTHWTSKFPLASWNELAPKKKLYHFPLKTASGHGLSKRLLGRLRTTTFG